ncbi:MAG: hypothetical protein M1818_005510 [Claussenomyces sp. TS43310]|nr:MAG: hypothetical protein M1818_005510 [Claussenomyces sp. TS43310]
MRTVILGILTTGALLLSSAYAECNDLSLEQVTETIDCGSPSDILNCLFSVAESPEATQVNDLQRRLEDIGCPAQQAQRGALWIASDCDNEMMGELRKRADAATTAAAAAATTAAPTTAGSTGLVCLATTDIPVTWCTTTTANNSPTSSCVTTSTPRSSCAAGLICATPSAGTVICMERSNHLTLSGLIVTIVFGVALAFMIGSMIFMCCRSRRESRAAARLREPAFAAPAPRGTKPDMESARAKIMSSSEAHLPLMATQGPAGGEYAEYGIAGARPGPHRTPSSTYQDVVGAGRTRADAPSLPTIPKLHPGLMSAPSSGGLYDAEEDDVGHVDRR